MRLHSITLLAATMAITATASASTLQLPKGFYATNINGQPVSAFDSNLQLQQGKQVVTLRYANPYRAHPQHHETVVSVPIYMVFNADASTNYQLNADLPMALKQAKAYARNPEFNLQLNGETIPHQAYLGQGTIARLLAE